MKTILITGASGFLGRRAARYFEQRWKVLTPSHRELELTDEENVRDFFHTVQPDLVLHCAAVSDVGRCEREPERSWRINVHGSVHLVKAAKAVGAKCVLCSSDQVYFGSESTLPHREDETLSPANVYGRQKLAMEQRCLEEDPGCVCLRLSWMYDLVKWEPGEKDTFFTQLLAALETGSVLTLPVHDRRGLTDVNRVVENMALAFTLPGGVYNFGSENPYSTFDLAERLLREMDLKISLNKDTAKFADFPRNLTMDLGKLRRGGLSFPTTLDSLKAGVRDRSRMGN